MLFGILSTKILSEGLTKLEYGTYASANIVNSLGASILLMGMPDALSFFFNKKEEDIDGVSKAKIVNTIFFVEIVLGAIYFAVVFVARDLIVLYFKNPAIKILLPIVAIIPTFTNLIYLYHMLYVSVGKAKIMSFFNLAITLIKLVFVYLAVYIFKNLIWIYVTLLVLEVIQIFFFNLFLLKRGMWINPFKISPKTIKKILCYGLPLGIYSLTSALTRELDKLVIARLGTTEELAIYTNCSKFLPVDFIVTSFAVVLIPYIVKYVSEEELDKSKDLFSSYMRIGYFSVWILGTMLLITPENLISFIYSDDYVEGKVIFILYVFDSMLRFANLHLVITSANKSNLVMIYSCVALALNLSLNIALYLIFTIWGCGIIGPAIATLITAIIYTYLIMRKSIKIMKCRWLDVFDIKEIFWLILSLICIWFFCSSINNVFLYIGLNRYVSMILSMALFGFSAFAIHYKKIKDVLQKINKFKI